MFLEKIVKSGKIPHALILGGPVGSGKLQAALKFATSLLKTTNDIHPDIHLLRPHGKIGLHSISTIRNFIKEVYLVPYAAKKKVFILVDADRMLPTSSNALLKTLEEPPLNTIIILITSSLNRILPTIISRAQIIRFQNKNELQSDQEKTVLQLSVLDALAAGSTLSYLGITQLVKELVKQIDDQIKTLETDLTSSQREDFKDNLNAKTNESIKNSVDGSLHMFKVSQVSSLFDTVLSWYRDLHLIDLCGDRKYLFNPDYQKKLDNAHQRGDLVDLGKLFEVYDRANIMVERSTTLSICLENFFLSLNRQMIHK